MLKLLNRPPIGSISIDLFRNTRHVKNIYSFRFLSTIPESLSPEIQARVDDLITRLPKPTHTLGNQKRKINKRQITDLDGQVFNFAVEIPEIVDTNISKSNDKANKLEKHEQEYWENNYQRYLKLFEHFTPKPKGPQRSFLKFLSSKVVTGGRQDVGEQSKAIAKQWKELPEEEKSKYKPQDSEFQQWKERVEEWKKKRLVEYAIFEKNLAEFELEPPLDEYRATKKAL
ncbi:uncharacterized protein J8A68_000906 [[Candida] subhashii]|uniref:HMG box domain-containing protein n=1 Tax=[Candida] subhashii TaxID=561895 RepID=A0A8J5QGU8_9ASCO|nr:uncharacterized protein J8A68_000906 [[Candida] subhashii]KAG7665504.1 hypothetical protein J8A68_000906 [[Candida] subhashii]